MIAVNLATGRMKWWQQQMAFNEWSYDTAQPPLVYTAKVGGKKQRVVSVATMEGVWFAYDAATGRPIYQRVKVIDRTEHPSLQPGKPVSVFPSSLGGVNYSPASFDPHTNYIFNAAAETASVEVQAELTPTQKKRKFTLGDVFLGLQNGNFGSVLPGWHDHGSISAIDVASGKRVWKFQTPEPERGGVTTTESGLGFAGGGDGVLRAFNLKTGKILRTFQTGHQIAAGPAIYSVNGTEYIAITSGGTPTSSNGGIASELQVFALGGSGTQSPAPQLATFRASRPSEARTLASGSTARRQLAASIGVGRVSTPGAIVVRPWSANTSNVAAVRGRVTLNGAPVAGAQVTVDEFTVPAPTAKDGSFGYDLDNTSPGRHAVHVTGASSASVNGRSLSSGQRSALLKATAGFNVGFAVHGVSTHPGKNGAVVVTGKLTDATGHGPPTVRLLTYQLSGTITDVNGKPVQGAVVITRTQDRDFWTHSSASDANGHYTSFYSAADETSADPVPLSVGVASGGVSYGGTLGVNASFKRLASAVLNIKLGPGTSYTLAPPNAYAGAVYSGLVVGVTAGGHVVKPLAERWPTKNGSFSMTLPPSVRGETLGFWENQRQFFSRFPATAGGAVDVASWPSELGETAPRGLGSIRP